MELPLLLPNEHIMTDTPGSSQYGWVKIGITTYPYYVWRWCLVIEFGGIGATVEYLK